MEHLLPNGATLALRQGDITTIPADAIANAANAQLVGGGGVDGAIHRAGGPAIMAELNAIRAQSGGCPTGRAVATTAGNLPALFVFHAVGPIWRGGHSNEPTLLRSAYQSCLDLAENHKLSSLTFPSISTGVYGYPIELAAPLAIGCVLNHLAGETTHLRRVTFVLFDARTLSAFESALAAATSPPLQ